MNRVPPVRREADVCLQRPRPARVTAFTVLVAVFSIGILGVASAQQLTAGPNVNMVGGPASITLSPTFSISGDPFLQRQNEPSMACSSRNPLNCLAGANDYRLVNIPGLQNGQVTGDAWLGVFWSRDGGLSWRSTVLPGSPPDNSSASTGSPIKGFDAAADPTVRAGTSGLFYYSGIAFSSAALTSSTGSPAGEGKTGVLFLSTFIDDNNTERLDAPIRYVRTVVVDNGTSGQFLDKPWIAADIPRAGAGTCTIPAAGAVPAQTVPAGNVYMAYSVFQGSGNNAHSSLLFVRSTDCGQTWSKPTKLDESVAASQSAMISVNPVNGAVLVSWRAFGTDNQSAPGQILIAQSTDFGQTFTKAIQVANLGATQQSVAYDQATAPTATNNMVRMFRTNGYPSACIDTTGLYRIAWSQRGVGPSGDARVVVATSTDGVTWSAPTPVDNHPGRGHQLMPAMACSADKAAIVWYDQRFDNAAVVFGAAWFAAFIWDPIPPPPAHTIDVRAAQTDSTGSFSAGSVSVSRYHYALDTTSKQFVQLEYNPVNWPLFAGGIVPFLGDYIDLAPARPFRPHVGGQGWTFNDDRAEAPVFHATWTDNRDILAPQSPDWTNWAPPGASGCVSGGAATLRNQNVYTARLSVGLVVGAEGNSRPTSAFERAFAVFVQNNTGSVRHFRVAAGAPPGGVASLRSGSFGPGGVVLDHVDADVPALSTIARTVYIPTAAATTPVVVQVFEIDATGAVVAGGLTASAIVNGDPTSPPPADPTIASTEVHTPSLTDAIVNSYPNPTFLNPTFLNSTYINPTFLNPTFLNPTFLNPTFLNPTFLNPTFLNPTFLNPTFLNPTFLNPTFLNAPITTDVSWQVTNAGNVSSSYDFSALMAAVPTGAWFQLLVNRVYPTPGTAGCSLGQQYNAQILATVANPTFLNTPASTTPSFALNAGDMAVVTLRVIHDGSFDPASVSARVAAQAGGSNATAVFDKTPPLITVSAPIVVEATSASGNIVTYTQATATDAVDGPVPVTCSPASGTLFPIAVTTVTCTATDAHNNIGTATFTVTVRDSTPPVIGAAPSNQTLEATSPAGAIATFAAPTATDNIDGPVPVKCVPASGSTFPLGSTTVVCTATDAHGNSATVRFTITVRDTTPPTIAAPPGPITAQATSPAGAVVTYTAPATSDLVDGPGVAVCSPASGSTFPMGATTVTCTKQDAAGNIAQPVSFVVTVIDTQAPALTAAAAPNTLLWSPNKTMTPVTISGTVTDNTAVASMSYAVVDEYGYVQPSGTVVPVGNTYTFTILLEAWRQGTDANGRVYTITVTAVDRYGNRASAVTIVTVPHNSAP